MRSSQDNGLRVIVVMDQVWLVRQAKLNNVQNRPESTDDIGAQNIFNMPSHTEQDPPLPWSAFLDDLDQAISEPTELHCIGGFVVSLLYGLPRPTGDV